MTAHRSIGDLLERRDDLSLRLLNLSKAAHATALERVKLRRTLHGESGRVHAMAFSKLFVHLRLRDKVLMWTPVRLTALIRQNAASVALLKARRTPPLLDSAEAHALVSTLPPRLQQYYSE